jgi:formylglycine-generating enzyme required for sulfatase activity
VRLILFSISSILLLAVTLSAKEPNRTWTSADGRTIEARFIDEKKGKVRIRRTDGRVFNIPLDNLSEEDRKYVESLAVAKPSSSTDQKHDLEDTDSKPNYFVKSALDLEMIWVEPGTFTMGQYDISNASPEHKVTLTQGFYLGKYEVTQKQYEKVMGENPSYFKGYNRPVECVSWNDAMAFCQALTKKKRKRGWEFTLPTEAQWEYACRAGTTTAYSWGDTITSDDANYNWDGDWNTGADFQQTRDVGQYSANPWGFFDMHGNVWEWTADFFGLYQKSSVIYSQTQTRVNRTRVNRGGSWSNTATDLRSATRCQPFPTAQNYAYGFRVAFQQVEKASEGSVGGAK